MKKWLKRIRGALGMGMTWAAAWAGFGAIFTLVVGGVIGGGLAGLFLEPLLYGMMGFVGGAAFSVVLGVTEGRRRFDEMSLLRFAACGAVGGVLLAIPLLLLLAATDPSALYWFGTSVVVALLGAGSAAGSLALARRADDRELLEHGADVADLELTEEEGRELLPG